MLSDDCGTACPLQVSLFFVRTSARLLPVQINTVVLSLRVATEEPFQCIGSIRIYRSPRTSVCTWSLAQLNRFLLAPM